jgi:enamine deaminase RidA (YjgF/YER057c/UK114 family)
MSGKVKNYPFYIGGVKQVYPNVHPGTPKYAAAVVVDNLVLVSGMTAQETDTGACLTGTVAEQTVVCLDKVRAVLEEVGSSMENIVKTIILLKDVKDYQIMRKTSWSITRSTRRVWWRNRRPAPSFSPRPWPGGNFGRVRSDRVLSRD